MKVSDIPWGQVVKVGIVVAGTLGLWEGTGARKAVMPTAAPTVSAAPSGPIVATLDKDTRDILKRLAYKVVEPCVVTAVPSR